MYVALCEQTALSAKDCLALAVIYKAGRKPEEALAWVERGLLLEEEPPYESMPGHDLAKLKRSCSPSSAEAARPLKRPGLSSTKTRIGVAMRN